MSFYLDYVADKYGKRIEKIYPQLYNQKPKFTYKCSNCGATFSRVTKHKGSQPFCSQRCSGLFSMSTLDRTDPTKFANKNKPLLPYAEIQRIYQLGNTRCRKLAVQFGCSVSRIGQIISGPRYESRTREVAD
jgi:hypothetical protein